MDLWLWALNMHHPAITQLYYFLLFNAILARMMTTVRTGQIQTGKAMRMYRRNKMYLWETRSEVVYIPLQDETQYGCKPKLQAWKLRYIYIWALTKP